MSIADEIKQFSNETFRSAWSERDGKVVPEPEDLSLGNDTVKFENAVILYADLAGSTAMVDSLPWNISAEIYKTFLKAAARLIRHHNGSITAYDGDRIMGVFIEGAMRTNAATCGLRINHAVTRIIQPEFNAMYSHRNFEIRHTVGIDCSEIRAARTGVRGDNDIVWVGKAANYAAKLSDINEWPYATYITSAVYDAMLDEAKISATGVNMWEARTWNNQTVYRSNWYWAP